MAYAAVVSLGQTIDDILQPDREVILHDKIVFEHLRERLRFLQNLLEEESPQEVEALQSAAAKLRDAAYSAEDYIELRVSDFKSRGPFRIPDFAINSYTKMLAFLEIMMPFFRVYDLGMSFRDRMFHWPYFCVGALIGEIDSFVEEAERIRAEGDVQLRDSPPSGPSMRNPSRESIRIGLDDDLLRMKDRLTGWESKLEVIPIVGMGGIGKTTLADNLYVDPLIVHHFHIRSWITLSQVYNVRDILLQLLDSLGKPNDEMLREEGNDWLREELYKSLYARRYLIVMDDVWSTDAWDDFKRCFPDNGNGSRIILTTRLERVAIHAGGSCSTPLHYMKLLSSYESWELLCMNVFGEEVFCPPELWETGAEIASYCDGLPLAIVVMGGILSKVDPTPDEWEKVAKNLYSVANRDADTYLEILQLSYNNLPQHLKACFLYMGVFPEDSKISVSKVIKLWVAEGFLKKNRHKTSEEVAEEYILELAERSLISVSGRRQERDRRRMKIIAIHDLLRDLCIREAQKEKFLYVMSEHVDGFPQGMNQQRRITINPYIPLDDPFFECVNPFLKLRIDVSSFKSYERNYAFFSTISLARSLVYTGTHCIPFRYCYFKLLRILHIPQVLFFDFPMEIIELHNLRYLAFRYHGEVPESISKLWNLQTLIFLPLFKTFAPSPRPLPLAIWSMPRLRHLKFHVWYLSDFPCLLPGWKAYPFLANLQTLSEVSASFCVKEVLLEVPNLKKLGIWMETWDTAPFYINNLVSLKRLEVLKCSVKSFPNHQVFPLPTCYGTPPKLAFPIGLKELTLKGCRIAWKDMTVVGSLPNLERLVLRDRAFVGPEWELNEGEFGQLKFLYLDDLDLVHWGAESVHFPRLRHLIVENCRKLEAINSDIGEISTLEIIELDKSSPSAVTSAEEIHEEQKSLGNNSLRVHIYPE